MTAEFSRHGQQQCLQYLFTIFIRDGLVYCLLKPWRPSANENMVIEVILGLNCKSSAEGFTTEAHVNSKIHYKFNAFRVTAVGNCRRARRACPAYIGLRLCFCAKSGSNVSMGVV